MTVQKDGINTDFFDDANQHYRQWELLFCNDAAFKMELSMSWKKAIFDDNVGNIRVKRQEKHHFL